jgi:hypothetical protein
MQKYRIDRIGSDISGDTAVGAGYDGTETHLGVGHVSSRLFPTGDAIMVPSPSRRSVSVDLELRSVPTNSATVEQVFCPRCKQPLTWNQPDSHAPDHLLGACAHCGCWCLLDVPHELHDAVMIRLPDWGVLLGSVP